MSRLVRDDACWAQIGSLAVALGLRHCAFEMDDELLNSVRAHLTEHDPDVLAAIEDVDRSLIQSELRRSPLERLVASVQQARFYERLAASRKSAQGGSR